MRALQRLRDFERPLQAPHVRRVQVGAEEFLLQHHLLALGLALAPLGCPFVKGRHGCRDRQSQHQHYRNRHPCDVPAQEFADAIGGGSSARHHRTPLQVATHIFGELFDGCVAVFGFLAQRH